MLGADAETGYSGAARPSCPEPDWEVAAEGCRADLASGFPPLAAAGIWSWALAGHAHLLFGMPSSARTSSATSYFISEAFVALPPISAEPEGTHVPHVISVWMPAGDGHHFETAALLLCAHQSAVKR